MDPPTYENSSDKAGNKRKSLLPPALLNLVPLPGEVSFQHGFLGFTASSIQGSLQVKFVTPSGGRTDTVSNSNGVGEYRASVQRVVVEFSGVERINADANASSSNELELAKERKVVWDRNQNQGEDHASTSDGRGGSGPPGNIDFEFRLTDDLPHCCHVGSASIQYTLNATLFSSENAPLSVTIPVHLSRTSPFLPQSSTSSSSTHSPATSRTPEVYFSHHPTEVSVFFPYGTSRICRSESIELRVRIPPPDMSLVQEKGLKLRSISAQLVRRILVRTIDALGDDEISSLGDRPLPVLTTIISKTGKSAAFSSSRSVFLNIWLQPVPESSCECITQSTIFQEVSFSVQVMATLMGRQGDREEVIVLDRAIDIIPDHPPTPHGSATISKAPDAKAHDLYEPASPARQTTGISPELLRAFSEEEEFDGYEQLSEGASVETAPPSIDADQPPPPLDNEEEGELLLTAS